MQLLIYLVAGILVTTTECTSIQNCPTGSLTVEKDADDVSLTCVGYTGIIDWEFRSPGSSDVNIGQCTTTTCTLRLSAFSFFYVLADESATSSKLTLTTNVTKTVQVIIYSCDRVECNVTISDLTTVAPTTTVITESTTEKTTSDESDDDLGDGAKAGIGVGCLILVTAAIVGGYLIWRKCKKPSTPRTGVSPDDKPLHRDPENGPPGNETGNKPPADNATDGRPGNETGNKPPADNATDGRSRKLPRPGRTQGAPEGTPPAQGSRQLPQPKGTGHDMTTSLPPPSLPPLRDHATTSLTSVERNSYAESSKKPLPSISPRQTQ